MPPTSGLTFGDLADAIAVARRIHPHLSWVIVPDEELPPSRYLVCPERETLYFARSLNPADGFATWIAALRELAGVAPPSAEVIPLHYPCPHPDSDRTG